MPPTIRRWHEVVLHRNMAGLAELLAEDVVFESPVVHRPQNGKAITTRYLLAAMQVLNNGSFSYLNEWYGPHSAVLEFQTACDGIVINGVDMVSWNSDGLITHFKVMVRPLKAMGKLHEQMGQMLDATAST